MADKFAKPNPRRTTAIAAARPSRSFLTTLSSLFNRMLATTAAGIPSPSSLAPLSYLFGAAALFIIAACAGRPVPTPAPPPTQTPPPPAVAAPPKPTETPIPAPAPNPTPAPDSSRKTLAALGAMSQITIGQRAICGLRSQGVEGNAFCSAWRDAQWGGDGAFTHLESGKEFQCGLRTDGKIVCQGANLYGETDPPEGEFRALAVGKRHACALDAAGKAVCWGWNSGGRADPPPNAAFAAIAAGHTHTCGIAEFGNLICWGSDSMGESEPREGPFAALALGRRHTCALRPSGEAFCQGDDSHGQSSPPASAVFSQISAGDSQTCGISPDGAIECWGAKPISERSGDFVSASVGYSETCARRADGYVECWRYFSEVETPKDESAFLGGAEFDQPVEMFPWPLGGLAIVERKGYVKIHAVDSEESRIALDMISRVYCCGIERGMLSATLAPDFDNFPFIYIYYQIDRIHAKDQTLGVDSFFGRVSRFPVVDDGEGGRIDADGELVILELPQSSGIHFGGALRFGPDGMLYASLGEDADCDAEKRARHECLDAQDLQTLSGKIIRLDVRGATAADPYRVPPDNPFVDMPNARPEIWASGMRNPYRIGFDREGNLLVADVGGIYFEELTIARAGSNLGWPIFEATFCRFKYPDMCAEVAHYTLPAHVYDHLGEECAIIGGETMPGPDGAYIFGDHCSGRVWALEGGYSARELAQVQRRITGFGTDADGAIYALTQEGPIVPITP